MLISISLNLTQDPITVDEQLLTSAMARSKHNKAAPKPIKPAQTTSKKKTLKKKIKTEGA